MYEEQNDAHQNVNKGRITHGFFIFAYFPNFLPVLIFHDQINSYLQHCCSFPCK